MEKEQVRLELKALIGDIMPELGDVDVDANIVNEYGINSVSIIRLIVAAEEKFGVKFVLSISQDEADLPDVVKARIIISL